MASVLYRGKTATCETWKAENAPHVFMASGEEVSQKGIPMGVACQ